MGVPAVAASRLPLAHRMTRIGTARLAQRALLATRGWRSAELAGALVVLVLATSLWGVV